MLKIIEHYPRTVIICIVLLMLGVSFQFLEVTIMEARNFITAREMISDGNWVMTTMNGGPRYQKPPLPTWFTAMFGMLFGIKNVFALRIPGILMLIAIGITARRFSLLILKNELHAFINALITITTFYLIAIIIEGPWDIFAHGFMYLAIYHLFNLFQKQSKYWNHVLMAGIFIGFSILCKGPVSLYALFLPFLIAYGVVYKYKGFKTKWFTAIAVLFLALWVGASWYTYVRVADPETFLKIASKETGNWSSYNVRPFYYYWSFFTQTGLWTIPAFISLLYPYLKTRVSNLKAYKFTLLWTLLAVFLLSVIPEKKSRYLVPVLIPLALNTGFYIEYLIRQFKPIKDWRETYPVYFNFGLIGLVCIAFPFIGFFLGPFLTGWPLIQFIIASIVLLGIGISIFLSLKRKQFRLTFYFYIAFMVAVFVFVSPIAKLQGQPGYNPVSNLKAETESQGLKVYTLGGVSPEIIWQFGDKLKSIKTSENGLQFPDEDTFGLLVQSLSDKDKALLSEQYTMTLKEHFDLNTASKDSRNYRDRLTNDYYILTKK
ncbi:glycosyltransferase [Winogradskyella sp. 3972H.M.0a.05]|uniref:ArnT family glycosyltransferase n=1 Tax=Winogradskyella sp. 3972H.M.0a.05 TaxID=2950277 RepID=UPI00339AC339